MNKSGLVETIAANETRTNIIEPTGLAFVDGHIYVSDSGHNRIKSISIETMKIDKIFGNGKKGFYDGRSVDAMFSKP